MLLTIETIDKNKFLQILELKDKHMKENEKTSVGNKQERNNAITKSKSRKPFIKKIQ